MSFDHMNPGKFADSAGVPWDGRHFEENNFAGDDGTANPALIEAITKLQAGEGSQESVIDAIRDSRLLIPLLANLGEAGEGAHGQTVDKSADLSIVTVETPDQQNGLPVFSSVAAMAAWNKDARPVPHSAVKAALAAAAEGNTRMVLDAGSPTEFVVRRPVIEAIAKGEIWIHPATDQDVLNAFGGAINTFDEFAGWSLAIGDPLSRLESAEVELTLELARSFTQEEFAELMKNVAARISESELIALKVDSLRVKLASA
jgi:hypothetical protein